MPSRPPRFLPHEIERVRRSMEADVDPEGPFVGDLPLGKLPAPTGRIRDRVGDICGVGRRTVDKIAELYAAAEVDPGRVGPIVEAMNRTGKVDGAHRRLRRMRDEDRVLGLAPRVGRFRTLVLDPPWEDESVSEGQRPPYATMSAAEIAAVPVPTWAEDASHIYCHAPGPWTRIAVDLIEGWGFAYKGQLAWRKSRWSMGRYFRTRTEFVVFGVRGGLMTRRQDVPNDFDGPVGQHSEKPEAFYALVRGMSYPPYGEAFQRRPRPDFADLFPVANAEAAE